MQVQRPVPLWHRRLWGTTRASSSAPPTYDMSELESGSTSMDTGGQRASIEKSTDFLWQTPDGAAAKEAGHGTMSSVSSDLAPALVLASSATLAGGSGPSTSKRPSIVAYPFEPAAGTDVDRTVLMPDGGSADVGIGPEQRTTTSAAPGAPQTGREPEPPVTLDDFKQGPSTPENGHGASKIHKSASTTGFTAPLKANEDDFDVPNQRPLAIATARRVRALFIVSLVVLLLLVVAMLSTVSLGLQTAYYASQAIYFINDMRFQCEGSISYTYLLILHENANTTVNLDIIQSIGNCTQALAQDLYILNYTDHRPLQYTPQLRAVDETNIAAYNAIATSLTSLQADLAALIGEFSTAAANGTGTGGPPALPAPPPPRPPIDVNVNPNILDLQRQQAAILDNLLSLNAVMTTLSESVLNRVYDMVLTFAVTVFVVLFFIGVGIYLPLDRRIYKMIQLLVDQYEERNRMTRDMSVVMKLTPNGIVRVDKEGHVTYANERWSEITGLRSQPLSLASSGSTSNVNSSVESLLADADNWQDYVHPDDIEGLRQLWTRTMHGCPTSPTMSYEFRFIRPTDNETLWILAQCLRDTASDTSGSHQLVDGKRKAASRDADRDGTDQNRPAQLDGSASATASALSVSSGVAADRNTAEHIKMADSTSLAIAMPSATPALVAAAGRPAANAPPPEIRGLVCAFTDLTQHKRMDRDRLEALQQASRVQEQRANEAEQHRHEQERFVDVICHEIRNPLNGIVNNMDLLKTSRDRILAFLESHPTLTHADVNAVLREMRGDEQLWNAVVLCTQHQRRITDDVLHISRLHSGYFTVEEHDFAIPEVVDTTIGMIRAVAESARVELACTFSDACAGVSYIRSDPQRISQVLMNFIGNAVKFTRLVDTRRVDVRIHVTLEPPPEQPGETSTSGGILRRGSGPKGIGSIGSVVSVRGLGQVDYGASSSSSSAYMPTVSPSSPRVMSDAALADALRTLPIGEQVWMSLSVTDSGIGMSAEEQAKLFLPFRQANVKTYTTYGGSGMGLFISKAIADLLNGEIRVRSKPGKGSTFTLLVPCTKAAPMSSSNPDTATSGHSRVSSGSAPPAASSLPNFPSSIVDAAMGTDIGTSSDFNSPSSVRSSNQALQGSGTVHPTALSTLAPLSNSGAAVVGSDARRYRIMVVDDNEINRRVLQKQLEAVTAVTMDVQTASNGQQAVDLFSSQSVPFDLVFMDIEMPIMDGMQATMIIRQRERERHISPPVPILGLSGNARQGMTDYIVKPYSKNSLLERIGVFLQAPISPS